INERWLEVRQFDVPSCLLRRDQQPDQNTQPDAVDVSHSSEIEYDLFALGQQLSHRIAQVGRLVTKHDSPIALNDPSIGNRMRSHVKRHVEPPRRFLIVRPTCGDELVKNLYL